MELFQALCYVSLVICTFSNEFFHLCFHQKNVSKKMGGAECPHPGEPPARLAAAYLCYRFASECFLST